MKRAILYRVFPLLFVLVAVAACGSGGTDSAGSKSTISVGKITGFGSVYVNGVRFETLGATIIKEGVSVGGMEDETEIQSHLRKGMIVTVEGSVNSNGNGGVAKSIEFKDILEGPVQSVDPAAQTLVVLGQTVIVDSQTYFDDFSGLDALSVGNVVEVSGFVDSNGNIHATYICLKSGSFTEGSMEIELKGIISNLDNDTKTFNLGSLIVNFSNAVIKDMPGGILSDGLYVEVKSIEGFNSNGELIASKVEADDCYHNWVCEHNWVEGKEIEIERLVTDVTGLDSEGKFVVNGQTVQITLETRFEDGFMTNIVPDVRLEVEGTLDADGTLLAREIDFESGDNGHDDDDRWRDFDDDDDHDGDDNDHDDAHDDNYNDDHDES